METMNASYEFDIASSNLLNETNYDLNQTNYNLTEVELSPLDIVLQDFRHFYIVSFYCEQFYTNFIVVTTVCILGYITNVLNVIVLFKTPLANSMNLFLMVLSAVDIFLITTQFSHIVHYYSGFKMYPHYAWVVFYIVNTYFENSSVFVSNWLVAVIGIWRLLVIARPLESRNLCTRSRAKITIVLIFIFSFGLSTMLFAQFTYETFVYEGEILYSLKFTDLSEANNRLFLKVQWAVQLLKDLLPMIIMVVTTFGLVFMLFWTRHQRKRVLHIQTSAAVNNRITVMLMLLLVLYWLSNMPDAFMFLIHVASDGDIDLQNRYQETTDILRIFALVNISFSFFIYYALGEDFRRRFNKLFCGMFKKHQNSEGVSDSSTVRSKNSDHGSSRKTSTTQF